MPITKPLPPAPPLRKLLGPSFILLGLGLGSGEVILWPYLTSHYGLGVLWGALLGISFQFIMNLEIERYALVKGESVFSGFARKTKWLPVWFLLSTFLPWIWPGIGTASGTLLASAIGFSHPTTLAMGLLILMGIILSSGTKVYKTLETFQKALIGIGVPTVFILSIYLAERADWASLARGMMGAGEGYWFLPVGIPLTTFLAALAFSGAGGNLNLAQSCYIREKGYGMGKYAGKLTALLSGKEERIDLNGVTFSPTPQNRARFNTWWRRIWTEHFVVFWLTGSITILLLSLLAYTTTYGTTTPAANISFVIAEAAAIGGATIPILGTFFLLVLSLTLFGTQMTVYDATSRIITENILHITNKTEGTFVSRVYAMVLWAQIATGIGVLLLGFKEPLLLLTIAAVCNAIAMFVHTGLTLWLNKTTLPREVAPRFTPVILMLCAFLFYGGFSLWTLWSKL